MITHYSCLLACRLLACVCSRASDCRYYPRGATFDGRNVCNLQILVLPLWLSGSLFPCTYSSSSSILIISISLYISSILCSSVCLRPSSSLPFWGLIFFVPVASYFTSLALPLSETDRNYSFLRWSKYAQISEQPLLI